MKWFKHFTDNHRGKTVQYLLDELGYFGPFFKDTLLEMCAEKLDRKTDRELSDDDCRFIFHRRVVESATRAKRSTVGRALVAGQTANFWTFTEDGEYFKIFAPILLDLLEYDQKKSRQRNALKVPESRLEKNRIEKNREEKNRIDNKRESACDNFLEPTESQKTETEKKIIPTDQRSDPPHHKLLKIWNEFRGQLPLAKTLNPTRDRKMKAIWPKLVESEWIEVVKKLSESNFCTGKNDRGWIADFDFLLKPETFSRTLEGRYDNRQAMNHGMTEDGLYLTRGQKVSHNNKKLIEKYFKQGSENAEPGNGDADAIDC